MKVNSFLNKIIENWPTKILCFVVALFLYLFYQISLVEKQTIVIPLSLEQSGGVVLKETVQPSVKVFVKTQSTTAFHAEDLKAVLDLSFLSETGEYDVPVSLTVSDELLAIDPLEIKIKPEKIHVVVEKKSSGAAFVRVPTLGEVKHGYQVQNIQVQPDIVQISGPESIIKNTSFITTDVISLEGLSDTKDLTVKLHNTNKKINVTSQDIINVKVVIEPLISEKVVTGVKPIIQNINPELTVSSVSEELTVNLSGPFLLLENITPSTLISRINLISVTEPGIYEFPVVFDLPSDILVLEQSSSVWKVTLEKVPQIINVQDLNDSAPVSSTALEGSN